MPEKPADFGFMATGIGSDPFLDVEATCRAFVEAAVAVNRPDELHAILWTAPRTAALQEILLGLDRLLMSEASWHLRRFGHPAEAVEQRAALLVTAVSAAIHQLPQDEGRDEELVRLCVTYVNDR